MLLGLLPITILDNKKFEMSVYSFVYLSCVISNCNVMLSCSKL